MDEYILMIQVYKNWVVVEFGEFIKLKKEAKNLNKNVHWKIVKVVEQDQNAIHT